MKGRLFCLALLVGVLAAGIGVNRGLSADDEELVVRQRGSRLLEVVGPASPQAATPKLGTITIQNRSGVPLYIWIRESDLVGQPYTSLGQLPHRWNVKLKSTRGVMWNVVANFGADPLSQNPNIYLDHDFLLKKSYKLRIGFHF